MVEFHACGFIMRDMGTQTNMGNWPDTYAHNYDHLHHNLHWYEQKANVTDTRNTRHLQIKNQQTNKYKTNK